MVLLKPYLWLHWASLRASTNVSIESPYQLKRLRGYVACVLEVANIYVNMCLWDEGEWGWWWWKMLINEDKREWEGGWQYDAWKARTLELIVITRVWKEGLDPESRNISPQNGMFCNIWPSFPNPTFNFFQLKLLITLILN